MMARPQVRSRRHHTQTPRGTMSRAVSSFTSRDAATATASRTGLRSTAA